MPVDATPVWLMRQAGRYLPAYRRLRESHGFVRLMKTPELACEVTLQPVHDFGMDAAIIFADILTPLAGMGLELEFVEGKGPVLHSPVRDAEDVANLLGAIAGVDASDSTTAPVPVPDYTADFGEGFDGLHVGVPVEFAGDGVEPGVRDAVERAIAVLEANGATIDRDVSLPSASAALPVYYLIAPSEASANLARYDGVKYGFSVHDAPTMWDEMEQTRGRGFGDEVKRRIMLGTYALSAGYYDAYYLKAQKVRTLIRREFEQAFAGHDLLLTPTTPSVAFKIGEKMDDPYAMYLNDLFTIPANIAGVPALSVPCGLSDGLPVGLHLIGRAFEEGTLLRAAHAYEQHTDWHTMRPPAVV